MCVSQLYYRDEKMQAPDIHHKGLSTLEAKKRLAEFGKNEIVPTQVNSRLAELFKVLKDPMGLMLLGLSLIYFLLGENTDAILLLVAYIPVTGVDVFLEVRAERALSILKSTFRPTAKVIRDGIISEISILEIVPGDIVALEIGQTLPADGLAISSSDLTLNEASLTGESEPLIKAEGDPLSAGTSVVGGRGLLQVQITGRKTKFGKIVSLLEESKEEQSPLQKKVNRLVNRFFRIALLLVIFLFVIEFVRGKSFFQSLLIALTFGMASVPEEFPLVFTLYLSLGAWRLAKSGVLVKSLPSVETLGAVDVICTDKTGTLTEGKFQLNEIVPFSDANADDLWQYTLFACEPIITDSMEIAILDKAPLHIDHDQWSLVYDYPFENEGKHMTHAWKDKTGVTVVAMKGAIEGVLAHCKISEEMRKTIEEKNHQLASQGYRLLGLAGKKKSITGVRDQDEQGLSFLGILTFSDPIRASAIDAVKACQSQGIVVKMITGDHPLTAHAIADQLGLHHSHDALYTGADLKQFSQEARLEAFRKGAVFSRVSPEQKFELVQALKNEGKIVAMTGDGINDAPALKIADIGISMGENATDTARATAKMILIKNDFNGIVRAILEGRRIFSSLSKSFSYLISFHIPIILLAFLPPALGLGEILLPIHIIMLELIVHPVSAFTFENHPGVEKARRNELISKTRLMTSALSGVLVSLFALVPFYFFRAWETEEKRSFSMNIVLFGNIGFILLETIPLFTRRMVVTALILLLITVLVPIFPTSSHLLHLNSIPLKWVFICLVCGILCSLPSFFIRRLGRSESKVSE